MQRTTHIRSFAALIFITFTLALSFSATAFAQHDGLNEDPQKPLRLFDSIHHYPIDHDINYYEDKDGLLSIDDIHEPKLSRQFKVQEEGILNFGFTKSAVWVKVPVTYSGKKPLEKFWFLIETPLLDNAQFYIVDSHGKLITHYAGYATGPQARDVDYPAPVFYFDIAKDETLTLYLRMTNDNSLRAPISILSSRGLTEHISLFELVNAAMIGAIFIMAIYNIFLAFSVRDKAYVFYILYIFTYLVGVLAERAHGTQLLGSFGDYLNRDIINGQIWLTYIFAFLMAKYFIHTAIISPGLNRIINITIAICMVSAVLANFTEKGVALEWSVIGSVFNVILFIVCGIFAVVKKVPGGNIYLIAWMFNFGGLVLYAFAIAGVVDFNLLTWSAPQIALILQITLLSFALGNRIKQAQHASLRANAVALSSLAKYKKLFNNALEGVFQLSPERKFIDANPSMLAMLGYKNINEINTTNEDALDLCFIDASTAQEMKSALAEQKDIHNIEAPYKNHQGEMRWAATSMRQVKHKATGEPLYIEGSFVDITDRVKEEQREKARQLDHIKREAAEASAQAKSDFLANMSHEIRTPLTAIIGYGESLQDESLTQDEKNKSAETIIRSGHHLLELINDILDQSSIDENKLNVDLQPTSLLAVIDEVKSYFEPKAEQKGLVFKVHYDFPLPNRVNTDPTRLKQILINLCGNALKFTSKGGIFLYVSCNKDNETVHIKIKDTGIGLKPEQISRLFTAYEQAASSTAREYGGTGLGLTISKRLSEMLGGSIRVTSIYGEGSEFEVTIATGMLSSIKFIQDGSELNHTQKSLRTSKAPKLTGSILYAEDNEINRRLVKMLIDKTGASLKTVVNGADALKVAMEETFDLILMDIQMPVMNGMDATEAIRQSGNQTPIVALTANIMADDIQQYKAAGCNECLGKPVDKKKFYEVLSHYLDPADETIELLPLFEGTVLLAEDNIENQMLMKRYLRKVGVEIVIVDNGEDAINKAQEEKIDIILMDHHMPKMEGPEAIKSLRSKNFNKPIYAFTASELEQDLQKLKAAGSNGIISKPVNRNDLYKVLMEHLPKAQASNATTDKEEKDALKPVKEQFLNDLPNKLQELQQDANEQNWALVRDHAHRMAGITGLLGYNELATIAKKLDMAIKQRDENNFDPLIDAIMNVSNSILKENAASKQSH